MAVTDGHTLPHAMLLANLNIPLRNEAVPSFLRIINDPHSN